MLSVVIIDSNIGFRGKIAELLSKQPDFNVIGQTDCTSEALALVGGMQPDLVLMGFDSSDSDRLNLVRHIQTVHPEAFIVVLTNQADDEWMLAAVRSGAKGYLLKSLAEPQLLASLRGLREGQAPISRTMVTRLMEEFSRDNSHNHHPPSVLAAVDRLTPRELDVLLELVKGGSNREIAARLFISEYTVKNHIHSILHKLEVSNRREAAKYAQIYGLVA